MAIDNPTPTPTPIDRRKKLYDGLVQEGIYTKDYDTFASTFSDDEKRRVLYDGLVKDEVYSKPYEEFESAFAADLKKKDLSGESGGILSPTTPVAGNITLPEAQVSGDKSLVEDVNFTGPAPAGTYIGQAGQAIPLPTDPTIVDPSKNKYGNEALNTLADAGTAFYNNLVASAPKMVGNTIKFMSNLKEMYNMRVPMADDDAGEIRDYLKGVSDKLEDKRQSPESQNFTLSDINNPKKLVPAIFAAGGQMSQMLLAAPAGGNVAGAIGGMQGLSAAFDSAKEANLSETDATVVAGIVAPAAFLLERAGIDITKAAPTFMRDFATQVIKETGEKITQTTVTKAAAKVLPKVVGGLGEGVTEGAQAGIELGVQAAYDATAGQGREAGKGNFGTEKLTLKDALNRIGTDALLGTIVGGITTSLYKADAPATEATPVVQDGTSSVQDTPEVQQAKQVEKERIAKQVVEGTADERTALSAQMGVDVMDTDLNELGSLINDYVEQTYKANEPEVSPTEPVPVPAPAAEVPDSEVPPEPIPGASSGTEPSITPDAPDQPVSERVDLPPSEVTVQVNKATYGVTKAEDGTYAVTNKRTGQPLTNTNSQNYQNAVRLFERQNIIQNADTGKRAEIQEGMNEPDYVRAVAETSENALEIAQAYRQEQGEAELSSKEQAIKDNLRSFPASGYNRFGDANNLQGEAQKRLNYFSKNGTPLDVQAQNITETSGLDISEQDIIDFVERYPNGAQTAKNINPMKQKLADRFGEITGTKLDDKLADDITLANEGRQFKQTPDSDVELESQIDANPQISAFFAENQLQTQEGDLDLNKLAEVLEANDETYFNFVYDLTKEDYENLKTLVQNERESENIFTDEADESVPTVRTTGAESESNDSPERKERQYTKNIIDNPETPAEKKARITDAARYYVPRTNEADIAEADELITSNGLDRATTIALDAEADLADPVKNVLLSKVQSMHDALGNEAIKAGDTKTADYHFNQADNLLEVLATRGTEFGQALQSFSIFSRKSPERHLNSIRKEVKKQRDKELKKHKKTIDRQKEAVAQGNTEAVNETLAKPEIRKKIEKAASIEGEVGNSFEWVIDKTGSKPSAAYGTKNKIVKQSSYEAARKRLRGKFYSTPLVDPDLIIIGAYHIEAGSRSFADFAKRMVSDLGRNIKPHLSDIYKASSEQLVKEGQYKDTDFDTDEGIADAIAKDDAYILAQRIFNRANKKAPAAVDPVKQMLDTLFKKVDEKLTPKEKNGSLSAIEKISLSIQQQDKYQQVWDESKKLVAARIEADAKLTPEQKAQLNAELNAYYKETIGQAFSNKEAAAATKKGIKDLDLQIQDIVKKHYTEVDKAKRTLVDKLVSDANLSVQQATELSRAVQEQFEQIATRKKQQLLRQKLTIKEKVAAPRKVQQLHEKIIELSNLGALSDAEFTDLYVQKMELPHLTAEQTATIMDLANKAQEAEEGAPKQRALEALLSYQTNLKGVSVMEVANSIWYANVLSGYTTQEINFFANSMEAASELAVAIAYNPKNAPFLVQGLISGYGRGALEALATLKTGVSPVRQKVEIPNVLERISFKGGNWNPFNYYKYVQRVMVAADTFTYHGLKEMRAYELAAREASKEGKTEPGRGLQQRVNEKLFRTKERLAEAQLQAESEGLKGNARKRRVYELMDSSRGVEIKEDASEFASRGTFNYDPEGSIGLLTEGVAKIVNSIQYKGFAPLRFIVPFTRIIANVANRYLDYSFVGYIRAAKGSMGFDTDTYGKKYREFTPEERIKETIKASIGTMAMLFFFLASDEEEGFLEITSNGTGNIGNNYELVNNGWQRYSVRIGDKWYSYMNTPLAIPLSIIGNMRDHAKYQGGKEDSVMDAFGVSLFKSMQYVTDMTFLKGVSEFMGSFNKENPQASGNFFKRFAASTTKGFIVPNLVTQLSKEYYAMTGIPMKEGKTFAAYLLKDIPVARNQFNDMVDALGDPIVPDTDRLTSNVESDKVWDLIIKNQAWVGRVNQKTIVLLDSKTNTERSLTDDEYYTFCKKRGEIIKAALVDAIDNPTTDRGEVLFDINTATPGEVQDWLSPIKTNATNQAKAFINGEESE